MCSRVSEYSSIPAIEFPSIFHVASRRQCRLAPKRGFTARPHTLLRPSRERQKHSAGILMNNNMKKCGLGPRSRIRQGIHINYIAVGCWLLAVGCHCQGHSPNLTKSESEAQSQSSARSTFAYEYEMQKHMVAAISMKINSTVIWESLNWSKQLRKFCVCGTELSISAQVDFAPLSVQFGTRIDDCCNCRFRSKIPF